jgi:hypothetical protein
MYSPADRPSSSHTYPNDCPRPTLNVRTDEFGTGKILPPLHGEEIGDKEDLSLGFIAADFCFLRYRYIRHDDDLIGTD